MLGPEGTLNAMVVGVQLLRHIIRYRQMVIHDLEVVATMTSHLGLTRVVAMLAVNVIRYLRSDNRLHTHLGSFQRSGVCITRLPAHHHTPRTLNHLDIGAGSREALVPHDDSATFIALLRGEVIRELAHKVRLQLTDMAESHLLHQCLTLGIATPCRCGTLVATDMNLLVGKDLNDFIKHILGKANGTRIGHIEHIREDTTIDLYIVRAIGPTTELRVCRYGSTSMTRELHLGHNLDVALTGICNQFTSLILCIEVRPISLFGIITSILKVTHVRVIAHTTHRGELRIFLDLDAPALVISEMPVEAVHLIIGHDVNHTLQLVHFEEMSAHIEHKSTISKARFIGNIHNRKRIACHLRIGDTRHHMRRKQLLDGLECIVASRRSSGTNSNTRRGNLKCITFWSQSIGARLVNYGDKWCRPFCYNIYTHASDLVHVFSKVLSFSGNAIGSIDEDGEIMRKHQFPLPYRH